MTRSELKRTLQKKGAKVFDVYKLSLFVASLVAVSVAYYSSDIEERYTEAMNAPDTILVMPTARVQGIMDHAFEKDTFQYSHPYDYNILKPVNTALFEKINSEAEWHYYTDGDNIFFTSDRYKLVVKFDVVDPDNITYASYNFSHYHGAFIYVKDMVPEGTSEYWLRTLGMSVVWLSFGCIFGLVVWIAMAISFTVVILRLVSDKLWHRRFFRDESLVDEVKKMGKVFLLSINYLYVIQKDG
ncbi:MAG: hypothetical protein NUV82_02580 [Candidatus Komeilibacteria bacterium]|nr:hypothetical protein [Candidatus Komeilibacteria bacterium]